ncbi:MAG TPA: hypothetical protein VL985_15035 [Stellaceae bacterium]|nr:hypothetical protein [Stellaceae bacterium]
MPLLYYYRPLQVTLDAFTQRFQLVVNDLGENYGYERQEIIAHFSYEFACLCFWLERPAYDPDLVDQALSATHTQALRDALTLITKIPTYEQKKVAERMGCSERSMPLPLDSFSKMATAILDVKTINDVSSLEIFNPLIKNLLDEIHSGEIKADVSLKMPSVHLIGWRKNVLPEQWARRCLLTSKSSSIVRLPWQVHRRLRAGFWATTMLHGRISLELVCRVGFRWILGSKACQQLLAARERIEVASPNSTIRATLRHGLFSDDDAPRMGSRSCAGHNPGSRKIPAYLWRRSPRTRRMRPCRRLI